MPAENRPDVLWVVTTQWRGSALGAAGDGNARTPWCDRAFRDGHAFPGAVTPHPHGPFARAALLTGRPCPENEIREYFDPLPSDADTIARRTSAMGYATFYFGKWGIGKRDPAIPLVGEAAARAVVHPDLRGGFDFWEGFDGGFLLNDPWLHGTGLPAPRRFPGYQCDVICGRASDRLSRADREPVPWFAVVSLEPPHPPYDASAGGVEPRDPGSLELSPNVPRDGVIEARARRELAGYYAHIEATDRAIGRLVDDVRLAGSRGRRKRIVVITSVHGDMHGAHGLWRKGWPHEESIRVPLVVIGDVHSPVDPGFHAGCVSLLDLANWTGSWAEGGNPWSSPPPASAAISMPSVVPFSDQCDRIWTGTRTRHAKEVFLADGSPWLKFDLENDPWERSNLVGKVI